jgi:hypothetical protein
MLVVGAVVVVGAVEYADVRLVLESAEESGLVVGWAVERRVVLALVGAVDSLLVSANGGAVALELSYFD